MKLEEVLPALRAGEVEGIRCDDWDPDYYWALRDGVLVWVDPGEGREEPVPMLVAISTYDLLDGKWSIVERKPVKHAVHIDGPEYARIRDGRQSALVLSSTIYRPGDILMIKDRDTREVLTVEVTHMDTRMTLTIVHFRLTAETWAP